MNFLRFLVSKALLFNLVIALILVLGGLYFTIHYLDDYTLHGYSMEVPNCEGKAFQSVDSILKDSDFVPIISDSIYVKGEQSGMVLEQSPLPGKKVKQGRKIYLTLTAENPPQVSMPNLVDMSFRQASALMETYGFELGELTYEPDPCMNCILSQEYKGEEIEPGSKVERGATIDLIIGQGLSNELTPIPYLIGLSYEMAKSVLKASYLNAGAPNYDESVLTAEDSINAQVYRQIPFQSDEPSIQMGSSVDLFLTLDTNRIIYSVNPNDSI